jgi:hypothetical protein
MILDEENGKATKQIQQDLKDLYIKEALERLAKDSKLSLDELQNIETNKPIPSEVGKRLRNLWIIRSGTTYFPAPKPALEPMVSDLLYEAQHQLVDLNSKIEIGKLAQELKTTPDRLQDFLQNKELIPEDIAIRLRYLWALRLGTSYHPALASVLDEPDECSIYAMVFKIVGKNEKQYKTAHIKDVLTRKIDNKDYDWALSIVMPQINPILQNSFKGNLEIEEDKGLSYGITSVCPQFRRFELEILRDDGMQYSLIYSRGILKEADAGLPSQKIITVLKNEGFWEK